jgi:LysR family cyn operon transcriptional activator
MRGSLHLGVVPILNVSLVPPLAGKLLQGHPGISLTVQEISSTEIETRLEEGQMDVGMGFVTRHSPILRYECLCKDEFALLVPKTHRWANRRSVALSELHQERILQLPDSFVMRRMTDEICRQHQVRPRTVAEINAIEVLLRSLAPLNAAAVMPRLTLISRKSLGLRAVRLRGDNLHLEIGLLRLKGADANPAVAAFMELARTIVPKLVADAAK